MSAEFIVALVIAVPVIVFPAALLWFINFSGLWKTMKARLKRRARQ